MIETVPLRKIREGIHVSDVSGRIVGSPRPGLMLLATLLGVVAVGSAQAART